MHSGTSRSQPLASSLAVRSPRGGIRQGRAMAPWLTVGWRGRHGEGKGLLRQENPPPRIVGALSGWPRARGAEEWLDDTPFVAQWQSPALWSR